MTPALTKARDKIAALRLARQNIESAPPGRDDIADALQAGLEARAAERIGIIRRALAAQEFDRLFKVSTPTAGRPVDLTDALLGLFSVGQIMDLMRPHLATLPEGVTATHRRAKLAEIDAELNRAEHAEQDVIDALERDGIVVDYRADARPEIVLRVTRP